MDIFDKGERVLTPGGTGTVIYRRMAPPTFAEVAAYSILLDNSNGSSSIYPAEKVIAINLDRPKTIIKDQE